MHQNRKRRGRRGGGRGFDDTFRARRMFVHYHDFRKTYDMGLGRPYTAVVLAAPGEYNQSIQTNPEVKHDRT